MSDDSTRDLHAAIELKKARLAQKRAAIDSEEAELAELERLASLAAKHNFVLTPAPPSVSNSPVEFIGELSDLYFSHPKSNVHKLNFNTRRTYAGHGKIIRRELGHMRIADITADGLRAIYAEWKSRWTVATAHTLIAKLRVLFSFGVEVLNDDGCVRARQLLSITKFETVQSTAEPMTEAQARLICRKAHEMGFPSIALAQAFQFNTRLKQADVIGVWTPLNEPGTSDIIHEKHGKWLRGIRWEKLDSRMKLRHALNTREGEIEIDLRGAPLVLEELAKLGKLPTSGPMIVREKSEGWPWTSVAFRQHWRSIADAAGLKHVKNKNSGAATQGPTTKEPLTNTAGT